MHYLKQSEIKFKEPSIDPIGKIFFYNNRVFRAINSEYTAQVREMFNSGMMDEIINKNLFIKTWMSDIKLEGYELIIEHEKIENWNYPYEWSFNMLKDAALVTLKLNKTLKKYRYGLHDPHTNNIVFKNTIPYYFDLGSFIKDDQISYQNYKIFYINFYCPLFLYHKGYYYISRNILSSKKYFNTTEFWKIKYPFINKLFTNRPFYLYEKMQRVLMTKNIEKKNIKKIYKKIFIIITKKIFINYIENQYKKLEVKIKNLNNKNQRTYWGGYHTVLDIETNKRFVKIFNIIKNLKDVNSIVDLAANQGKFSSFLLKNTQIKKIISVDYDELAVDIMYQNNKNKKLLPIISDVIREPGNINDKNLYLRIKSDLVLALAITHHLILTENFSLEYILEKIKKYTNKYIIIEFMPLGLYNKKLKNVPKIPKFYTLNWFRECFCNYFDLIYDEKLETNRHVFFGKIKK